jgi:hypothetical protein
MKSGEGDLGSDAGSGWGTILAEHFTGHQGRRCAANDNAKQGAMCFSYTSL